MATLERTPGRKVTRRLKEPSMELRLSPKGEPGMLAEALAACHNQAVQQYGSNSGGWHAYSPDDRTTTGVYESGSTFPRGTVVSDLAWGRIDPEFAQRLLEYDGVA